MGVFIPIVLILLYNCNIHGILYKSSIDKILNLNNNSEVKEIELGISNKVNEEIKEEQKFSRIIDDSFFEISPKELMEKGK